MSTFRHFTLYKYFNVPVLEKIFTSICSLDGHRPVIHNRLFADTHLDHLDGENRLKQIKEFQPHKEKIEVLLDDMNTLTREDYSDDCYRQLVVEKRQKPRFDLIKLIREEMGYEDAFKLMNPQMKDQWTLTKCENIDIKRTTDHHAVYAAFELKSK